MKKVMLVTLLMGGLAFAASLNVPFFLDTNTVDTYPPPAGTALTAVNGFIGLHNNTGSPIVITVTYRRANGVDITPAANTFSLSADTSVSWTPVTNLPSTEGVGAGVPNASGTSIYAGSATISWSGNVDDIQGRYVQVENFSGAGLAGFGHLLPPGF